MADLYEYNNYRNVGSSEYIFVSNITLVVNKAYNNDRISGGFSSPKFCTTSQSSSPTTLPQNRVLITVFVSAMCCA